MEKWQLSPRPSDEVMPLAEGDEFEFEFYGGMLLVRAGKSLTRKSNKDFSREISLCVTN